MSAILELNQSELTKSEVIYGVSWEMYESLIEKYWGENCPRMTYDSGIMEVEMSNSDKHEEDNRILAKLVELILEELEIDYRNLGSTTYKKKIIRKGFEPDSCFYIQSLHKIRGKSNIGIENKVPPDLTIEINRTSSSVPRMPIFAAFGVKEIWRLSDDEVKFYTLEEGVYLETANSIALPILSSQKATDFLSESRETGNIAWTKKVRNWVNEVK
jgi:Uma2 family endonuclease